LYIKAACKGTCIFLSCTLAPSANAANKASFAAAGGIPPLVALLGGGQAGNAGVMEQACRAVVNVTDNNDANRAAFIAAGGYRVVDLNPDFFFTNFNGNAGEAKTAGTISLPVSGGGPRITMIDPRDVGASAAAILLQPAAGLAPFLARRVIEVHGASRVNFADVAAALSAAAGYPIAIKQVPREAWAAALQGYGVPRVFAASFLETVEQADGVVPPGYEAYGAANWPGESSAELLAIGWKAKTLEEWAGSAATKAVWAK
jgi:hypothetical protein